MDLALFFAFAQCSLRVEAQKYMAKDFPLKDPQAEKIWRSYEQLAKRNLGKNEKWVPWHTVLGVHEFFLVKEVHHAKVPWWTDYHRFVAMFIFRCHCKRDLFSEVQMPHLQQQAFWEDIIANFSPGSQMDKDMMVFRKGGRALQTGCFLIIPERLVPDLDQNLVLNILQRTQRLINLANTLWPIVHDKTTSPNAKFDLISRRISEVKSLGDTWVKMLMVCIDICKPDLRLLHNRCEVGVGAADPLRKLLEDEGLLTRKIQKYVQASTPLVAFQGVGTFPHLKYGTVSVKRDGRQLVQVTKSMATSFDRAHAIAEELARIAVRDKLGTESQAIFLTERQRLIHDWSLQVPALGLDAKMEEVVKNEMSLGRSSGETSPSEALGLLCERINTCDSDSAKHFWAFLQQVEQHAWKHFKDLNLVTAQMQTQQKGLSAVTLQVQLCEFRQFQNFIQRPSLKRPHSAEKL